MQTPQSNQRGIQWRDHFFGSSLFTLAIILVNAFHFVNGHAFDWFAPLIVFGTSFFCFLACDIGKDWRFPPPYLFFATVALIPLARSVAECITIGAQSGNAWLVSVELLSGLGSTVMLMGMFAACIYSLTICGKIDQMFNRITESRDAG